jgi:hypothetical protein
MSPRLSPEFDFDALREQANRERAEVLGRQLAAPFVALLRAVRKMRETRAHRIGAPFPRSAHVQGRPSQG